jgi:HAD superfamily hydrolase (TIGR01549 family)
MNYIFDFDGTIIKTMCIDYTILKNDIKKILGIQRDLDSMYESINNFPEKKQKCYELIDSYELNEINNYIIINKKILDLYIKSNYKIIISRNGLKVINYFFEKHNLPKPDFISCRDNCNYLKPNIEQINIILTKFPFLNKNNICIVGDSWHDKQLANNFGCEFFQVN